MTLLGLRGIGKRYGATLALEGIDLDVPAGSRTAIVGPSGSGKTTLLRIVAGFEAPDLGRVTLDARVLAEGRSVVPAHRREIGVVPQDGALFPHLDVARNIGFGLDRTMPQRDRRIRELMDIVELDARMAGRRPHELSGGQQQRVALARALARQPKLMLLDEPFSALDTGLREAMRKAVATVLRTAAITAVLVTHDQAEALSFADQVAILREGRLVQVGSPEALYRRPNDRATAAFLGDAIILPAEVEEGCVRCGLGCIVADTGSRRGTVDIMLRPEQLRLTQVAPGMEARDSDTSGCFGRVTAVEFGGATSTISLVLAGPPGSSEAPLRIRTPSIDLPPAGATVLIAVMGSAHILG